MSRISLNNGQTFDSAETVDAVELDSNWDAVAELMDADTRERVHAELAPCTNAEFLARYLESAPQDLVVG